MNNETIISEYEQQAIDFLQSTNTKLDIVFKEFGSMPWDNDKQKRNIFSCTLHNEKHSYTFDFGSSVVDSCGFESKMSQLIESDEISVYAGLKSINNKAIQAGIIITLTKNQLLNTDYDLLTKYFDELEKQINIVASEKNKKAYSLFDDGKISRDERDIRLFGAIQRGIVEQTVQNSIKRKIEELETEQVYSKSLQSDNKAVPTAYDILASITKYDPYSFEDFCSCCGYDEDSRQAERTYNAVYDEWKELTNLFTDAELELLQEIQ